MYKQEFNSKCHVYSLPSLEAYVLTNQKLPNTSYARNCLNRSQPNLEQREIEQWPVVVNASDINEDLKSQLDGRAIDLEDEANASTIGIVFEMNMRPSPLVNVTDHQTQKTTSYYMGVFGANKIPAIEKSPAIEVSVK